MRETKFRYAWKHEKTGEIKLVIHTFATIEISNPIVALQMEGFRLLNRDLCTDLKDKNGVEIYEGDILGWWYWDSGYTPAKKLEFARQVTWSEHGCWNFDDLDRPSYCEREVIGNIHQNPELLEKK